MMAVMILNLLHVLTAFLLVSGIIAALERAYRG